MRLGALKQLEGWSLTLRAVCAARGGGGGQGGKEGGQEEEEEIDVDLSVLPGQQGRQTGDEQRQQQEAEEAEKDHVHYTNIQYHNKIACDSFDFLAACHLRSALQLPRWLCSSSSASSCSSS